ncbi:unnamed protein product [Lupinus luteus]|uniref:PPC domain-containing protein n=1 Tax=Lupinus luteus TaxID=3873 RepID=A0AAV1XZC1_LUPLU
MPNKNISVTRRSSGRPRGSKNKPKPPIIVTTESPNAFKSCVFEFTSGVNIAESLLRFATTRQRGLCVLSATGTVADVTLRQADGGTMVFRGQFGIIIMNGLFVPPGSSSSGLTSLNVYLGRGQGRMIGGTVVGPLVAAGPVMVMAATFANAIYVKNPLPNHNNDEDGLFGGFRGGDGGHNISFRKK